MINFIFFKIIIPTEMSEIRTNEAEESLNVKSKIKR